MAVDFVEFLKDKTLSIADKQSLKRVIEIRLSDGRDSLEEAIKVIDAINRHTNPNTHDDEEWDD